MKRITVWFLIFGAFCFSCGSNRKSKLLEEALPVIGDNRSEMENVFDQQLLNDLEEALQFAGKNRSEMEKVLSHYRQHQSDSLKYRAAVFLVTNMPWHYSYKYPEYAQEYYAELRAKVSPSLDNEANKKVIESISSKYNNRRFTETVWDMHVLTGDYLIDNIDRAFELWQNGEWATHVSYDDFCEYLLPYKSTELQPLDNWREYAKDMLKGDLDLLQYCDLYNNLSFQAATSVSNEIIGLIQQEYPQGGVNALPLLDIRTVAHMLSGSCSDYTFLATPIMRSKGIPVMEDFTPQWPFQMQGHSWSVVLNNYGMNMVFSAGTSNPGELHKPDERMAKVFRRYYAINRELLAIQQTEKSVPPTFKNLFIKDVTNEYMTTQDVEIDIPESFSNKFKYAYIAVFNNRNWIPIHYGKIDGQKVRFTDMGRNCMYMPVFYSNNQVVPFSKPFFITPQGVIRQFEAHDTQTTDIHLYRKYHIAKHCYGVGHRMQGGRFEAANHADFSDAVFIHEIPNFTVQSGTFRIDSITTPYRYWRYYSADSCHSNVAELYFYQPGNEKPVYGQIIGTDSSYNDNPDWTKKAVFDDDPLTFFDAPDPSDSWVGLDFGKPVRIEHISYTPRGDGNDITPGDTHELLYWHDHKWVSLGKRVANDILLVYENVPANTIYWIRNLSRGKDERIFIYEDGKQKFF